jgi:hypothetical protein
MASTSPSEQLGPKPQPAALRGARAADTPWAAIGLVLLFALAFYLWTADTSIPFSQNSNDVYNLLATAFLHGHTYLPIKVPAGLLHLSHPYNPADNSLYSDNPLYHDLSLDHGHFYSSWGPTPLIRRLCSGGSVSSAPLPCCGCWFNGWCRERRVGSWSSPPLGLR